jgi:hypothetical protein
MVTGETFESCKLHCPEGECRLIALVAAVSISIDELPDPIDSNDTHTKAVLAIAKSLEGACLRYSQSKRFEDLASDFTAE